MLASKHSTFNFWLLIETLIGISLVIASACVINNYIDRDIDKFMERTKNRAFVKKTVPVRLGMIYAIVLGICGFIILAIYTNWLTVLMGLIGFADYVLLYSPSKRTTHYSTLIGSVAGAMPIVAGYTAVTGSLDGAAILIFMLLVFWQMPHFYAIGVRRIKEYKTASLPILPVKKGIKTTKAHIFFYILAFLVTVFLLTGLGYTGNLYLAIVGAVGIYWLILASKGFKTVNNTIWAKKVFLFSLVVNLTFSIMFVVDSLAAK